MKRIFTLMLVLVTVFTANAQPDETFRRQNNYQGIISVSYVTNDQVWILIDGRHYNANEHDDEMTINYVKPGYHSIKVYRQKRKGNNIGWNQNRKRQLIYEGNLYVKPRYHVDVLINRFGKVFIDERQMNAGNYYDQPGEHTGWSSQEGQHMQPMNRYNFEQFKQVVRNESFDNTRLVLAKQTIGTNYFSSAQVREILELFSFENNKLDIAKYCYAYTVDKSNYFILNDAFSFSGSKEELTRYIKEYR